MSKPGSAGKVRGSPQSVGFRATQSVSYLLRYFSLEESRWSDRPTLSSPRATLRACHLSTTHLKTVWDTLSTETNYCLCRRAGVPVRLISTLRLCLSVKHNYMNIQDISTTSSWDHHLPKALSPDSRPAWPGFYMFLLSSFCASSQTPAGKKWANTWVQTKQNKKAHLSVWCAVFPPCQLLKMSHSLKLRPRYSYHISEKTLYKFCFLLINNSALSGRLIRS